MDPSSQSSHEELPDENASAKRRTPRRPAEIVAVMAIVIAVTAIAVALWGDAPAKATTPAKSVAASRDPAGCGAGSPKLTVQGAGVATGTPDLLTVDATITVTSPNAEAALAEDNTETGAVQRAVEGDGVVVSDISTTNLSVQPNYVFVHDTNVLAGYSVTDSISVDFHAPFSHAGTGIDAMTAAVGNDLEIDSLNFSFADPRTLEDQARADAVGQAMSHARSMASAAGESLGGVCSVTDDSSNQPDYYDNGDQVFAGAANESRAAPSVPLTSGTQQESDQVTLVFALKRP